MQGQARLKIHCLKIHLAGVAVHILQAFPCRLSCQGEGVLQALSLPYALNASRTPYAVLVGLPWVHFGHLAELASKEVKILAVSVLPHVDFHQYSIIHDDKNLRVIT